MAIIDFFTRKHKKEIGDKDRHIKELRAIIADLKNRLGDPREVVKNLTDDKFKFFDYEKLKGEKKSNYFKQAQMILETDVLQNEIAHNNSELALFAARHSKDYKTVVEMRDKIAGQELLRQALEDIVNPEKKVSTTTDIHKPV